MDLPIGDNDVPTMRPDRRKHKCEGLRYGTLPQARNIRLSSERIGIQQTSNVTPVLIAAGFNQPAMGAGTDLSMKSVLWQRTFFGSANAISTM